MKKTTHFAKYILRPASSSTHTLTLSFAGLFANFGWDRKMTVLFAIATFDLASCPFGPVYQQQ
jgi:hypothetical protein